MLKLQSGAPKVDTKLMLVSSEHVINPHPNQLDAVMAMATAPNIQTRLAAI